MISGRRRMSDDGHFAAVLAWSQLRSNYRRSVLGPWWLTIGMAVQVVAISLIFPAVFGTDRASFAPYLAVGVVIWTLISSSLMDAARVYPEMESFVRQAEMSHAVPVLKTVFQNFVILGHHAVFLVVWLAFFRPDHGPNIPYLVAGLVVLFGNVSWIVALLSLLGARYRDIPPLVSALLNVSFFLTPILWEVPDRSAGLLQTLLLVNPFFHLIEIVRAPILGNAVPVTSFLITTVLGIAGAAAAIIVSRRFAWRVAYWV